MFKLFSFQILSTLHNTLSWLLMTTQEGKEEKTEEIKDARSGPLLSSILTESIPIQILTPKWKQLPDVYRNIGIKLLVEENAPPGGGDLQRHYFICIVFPQNKLKTQTILGGLTWPAERRCDGVLVGPIWCVETGQRITRAIQHKCHCPEISWKTSYQTGVETKPHYYDDDWHPDRKGAGIYYFPLSRHDDILSLWPYAEQNQDFIHRIQAVVHLAVLDVLQREAAHLLWNVHAGVLPWKKLQ